ncbi:MULTISPECIES: peptidylprolyl isomerase [unclassified Helicobacter]|uniref:peptidylprolyl isomerase n=1 Tax=unclassified Helicobacter TaxID=2593540 RepID=UPI000CF061B1|nr:MULTISPECIES: peptidylprolyl isomerase [unclassified Helicobacter]
MSELKIYDIDNKELEKLQYSKIHTNRGVITLKLFPNEAPQTVTNFATLANQGFYNNLKFHRVIPDFVAQGGCPNGIGTGGPGYRIKCEVAGNPHKHIKGALSMAHAGRDTGGSQFFICFSSFPHLDGEHTVFGQIDSQDQESMNVLDSIKQNDVIEKIEIFEKL